MVMYITHHPDDHDQCFQNKRNRNKHKSSNESSKPIDSKPKNSLSFANNMRAAMLAKFSMSESEAEILWTEI